VPAFKNLNGCWILFGLASGLTGCEPAKSEFDCALPGQHQMVRTATQHVQIVRQAPHNGTSVIPPNVVEIATDGRIVLVKRQLLVAEGGFPSRNVEKLLDRSFDYWILDTEKSASYGPLSEDEFLARRGEFGAADRLPLMDVQFYSDQCKRYGSARYNVYYWLTFAIPALIMFLAAFVRGNDLWWGLAIICIVLTTIVSGQSIWTKWSIRRELFPETYFENTGNLAFSYIIGPFEGLAYTGLFAILYYPIRRLAKASHSKTDRCRGST
jgi:Protein of unknown function (DUF3997)